MSTDRRVSGTAVIQFDEFISCTDPEAAKEQVVERIRAEFGSSIPILGLRQRLAAEDFHEEKCPHCGSLEMVPNTRLPDGERGAITCWSCEAEFTPQPYVPVERVVKVILYEGSPEWIKRMVSNSLADGEHFREQADGVVTVKTVYGEQRGSVHNLI